jgi:hypothetical protein
VVCLTTSFPSSMVIDGLSENIPKLKQYLPPGFITTYPAPLPDWYKLWLIAVPFIMLSILTGMWKWKAVYAYFEYEELQYILASIVIFPVARISTFF